MIARLKTYGTLLLVAALLIAVGIQTWRLRSAQAAEDELATDLLIAELEADSFEVTIAKERHSYASLLGENDSLSQRLRDQAETLEDLRARMAIVTRVEATAGGEAEAQAELHMPDTANAQTDTVGVNAREEMTETGERVISDSITAHVEDGPLTADIMCRLFPARCRLGWAILISGSLLHVQGPDGRLIVVAEADDPRVTLRVPALEWVPPDEPVRFPWGETVLGCGLGTLAAGGDKVVNDGRFRWEWIGAGCGGGTALGYGRQLVERVRWW